MAWHNRKTDELLLMEFAIEQGYDDPELMAAVERLRECHQKDLLDYASPGEEESPPITNRED
jgi:hypothetical protein